MSRWLSNNPEDYTIGRLAVVPCATACTGLRWGPYEPFKRAGCVADSDVPTRPSKMEEEANVAV